jgi:pyruvate kinase
VQLAEETKAKALVVFTHSGFTAHLLSSARPLLPLIALTDDDSVYRRMALWWGLRPVRTEFARTIDATIETFQETLMAEGLVDEGELIVIVGSSIRMTDTRSNVIKLHVVGRD